MWTRCTTLWTTSRSSTTSRARSPTRSATTSPSPTTSTRTNSRRNWRSSNRRISTRRCSVSTCLQTRCRMCLAPSWSTTSPNPAGPSRQRTTKNSQSCSPGLHRLVVVRTLISLFAVFHYSTATIDVAELKKTAQEKLNNAKENLQALHKTASSELSKLVMGINLENAKKLDIFHIIPKVTKKVAKVKSLLSGESKKPKKEALILDPYQAERLNHHFAHSKYRIIVRHYD
ncbi:uncharacterized protein LOC125236305 isoform X1 [Leguminivora glycinivorella]|uniref:uncharacterized protein LOC125236305 isoform X1 n=1 Tax=Leguminivora glycinivorella TaxID=1035111 RepID=UPI002010867A|nr:uncharacterized protein LOC125236305 isoform X1 [Leguminivora glycinivorella]